MTVEKSYNIGETSSPLKKLMTMESKIHHGRRLRQLLELHHIDVPGFFELFKEEIQSLSTIYKLLESEEISKARLCLICTLFEVAPSFFGKPDHYFDSITGKKVKKDKERIILFNYLQERRSNYAEFVSRYFQTFTEYLFRSQQSIYVLDYLASKSGVKFRDHTGYFHEQNSSYFNRLQDHIQNRLDTGENFDYRRVCQLPLEAFPVEQGDNKKEPISFLQKIEFVVESLFVETFKHFCQCYEQFPNQFKLYVIERPVRLFSYYIADDQWILSEYLRFDITGKPIADMVFLDEVNQSDDTAKLLIENYLEELKKLWEENPRLGQKQIPRDLFYFCTGTRLVSIEQELRQQKQALKEIEQQFSALISRLMEDGANNSTADESEQEKELAARKHHLEKVIAELEQVSEHMQTKRDIAKKYYEN